jgi:ketosteroid isomerase-like protein
MNKVIESLLQAMNSHDLEAMVALFDPDYRSEQPAHPGRAFVGRSQVHANWGAMFAGTPDFTAELLRSVEDGDTVWCEWSWSGRRADEHPFAVRGVTLFRIRDDLIAAATLYVENVETEMIGIEQAVEEMSGRRPLPPRE